MGRDAAPANGSGEAEGIEPAGIVVGNSSGEEGSFPFDSGSLKAFELVESFEDAIFSAELGLGGEMLPVEQPAQVDGGSYGFDLLAESAEGEAVDALEDAALAPFDLMVVGRCGLLKSSAHEEALHLHGKEGLEDCGGVETEFGGKGCGGRGTEDL